MQINPNAAQQLLASAKSVLDAATQEFNHVDSENESNQRYHEEGVQYLAENACVHLRLLLECLGAPLLSNSLKLEYEAVKSSISGRDREGDLTCPFVDVLYRYYYAAEAAVGIIGFSEYQRLLSVLRNSDMIIKLAKVEPSRELDVNKVMFQYLSIFYPDATKRIAISDGLKAFKPEFGIKSAQCAVEYKFVKDENQLQAMIDQIYADILGYGVSKEWTRFISVFYCAEKFITEEQLEAQFAEKTKRLTASWDFVLVVGNVDIKDSVPNPSPGDGTQTRFDDPQN